EDPVKSMEQARRDDPESEAFVALIEGWREHFGVNTVHTTADIIKRVNETKQAEKMGDGLPNIEYVLRELRLLLLNRAGRGPTIDAARLGKWLLSVHGRVHAGFRIVRAKQDEKHGNRWTLEKV